MLYDRQTNVGHIEKKLLFKVDFSQHNFMMIDRIIDVQSDHISACKRFNDGAAHLALEACAQLGAFHIRLSMNCSRHVFLMKIKQCEFFSVNHTLSGIYSITANLLAKSTDAYSYKIHIKKKDKPCIKGIFIFAVADYDERFQSDILMHYYQSVCQKLLTKVHPNCPQKIIF
jgi:3-hydroxymyristoyl/3-hydroxydecanoyl-(acyl carrier protein) dehydratase